MADDPKSAGAPEEALDEAPPEIPEIDSQVEPAASSDAASAPDQPTEPMNRKPDDSAASAEVAASAPSDAGADSAEDRGSPLPEVIDDEDVEEAPRSLRNPPPKPPGRSNPNMQAVRQSTPPPFSASKALSSVAPPATTPSISTKPPAPSQSAPPPSPSAPPPSPSAPPPSPSVASPSAPPPSPSEPPPASVPPPSPSGPPSAASASPSVPPPRAPSHPPAAEPTDENVPSTSKSPSHPPINEIPETEPESVDGDDDEPPRSAAIDESARARRARRSLMAIPDDDVPPTRTETSKQAIAAMRIVTVGDPDTKEAPPPEKPVETPEPYEDIEPISVVPVEIEAPAPAESAPAESASAESASAESASAESASTESAPAKPPPPKRPPPPPRKSKKSERLPSPESVSRRRPWWEELFGDDFNRSHARIDDAYIGKEVDFIEGALGVAKGGILLDLACGGGYHAVELASRGYGVVGYDLSLTQLALAADTAQERNQKINFLQGDMREMAFEEMFDGVFCWNTSFGYFEEEKNFLVAQRMFKALRPGGMLLLDVANRDWVVSQQPSSVWYEGDACVCMDEMRVDFITSRLKVKRTVMLDDGRTLECNYSLRLYGLHELGKLLHSAGFRVSEVTGHPSTPGVFFGGESPRIIVLAERPED